MKITSIFTIGLCALFFGCKEPKQAVITPAPEKPTPKVVQKEAAAPAPVTLTVNAVDEPMMDSEPADANVLTSDQVMAFIVSFYSIGEGIDRGEQEKLLAFIDSFGKEKNSKIEFSEVHWGREGETDYCFPLAGLPDMAVSEFKTGVRNALKSARHVHFLENQACRKGR